MKHSLLGLAILLIVIWFVVRVVLAVSGFFLHILWIAALVALAFWLFGLVSGKR